MGRLLFLPNLPEFAPIGSAKPGCSGMYRRFDGADHRHLTHPKEENRGTASVTLTHAHVDKFHAPLKSCFPSQESRPLFRGTTSLFSNVPFSYGSQKFSCPSARRALSKAPFVLVRAKHFGLPLDRYFKSRSRFKASCFPIASKIWSVPTVKSPSGNI